MRVESTLNSARSVRGIGQHAPAQVVPSRVSPLATNSALLFTSAVAGAGLGVLFWTLAARLYDLASVGLAGAAVSAATLVATFSNLGLSAVVVRYLPTAGSRDFRLRLTATVVPGLIAPAMVAGLAMWPAGQALLGDLGKQGEAAPALLVGMSMAMAIAFVQDSIFIARQKAGQVMLRSVAASMARLALLAPFARWGAVGLLGIFTIGALIMLALGAPAWNRPRSSLAAQPLAANEMAAYGLTNYFGGLLAQAPPMLYPILIATHVSHAAAGAFNFAWMPVALLMTLPPSIANVYLAQLVGPAGASTRRLDHTLRAIVVVMAVLATVIYAGMALIAPIWLPSGSDHVRAYLPLLLLGVVLFALVRMQAMLLAWRGQLRALLTLNALVALVAIGLPVLLLPRWGVIGLEVGWLLSQIAGVGAAMSFRRRDSRET